MPTSAAVGSAGSGCGLGRLLELVGQLNSERVDAGGLFSDPEPREDQGHGLARHCADRLAMIAAVAIDFAVELAASFEDGGAWAKARDEAINEIRDEPLADLASA